MEILIFIVPILLCALTVVGFSLFDEFKLLGILATLSLSALTVGCIVSSIVISNKLNEPVIIKKSSDSDWELSNDYSIKSDTCITEIRIVNGVDTVYPTTCYKILRHGTTE